MGAPTGLRYVDPDYLPLAVAIDVLGHGFTSRLTSTVRDSEGLTYGIEAELAGTGKLEQVWLIQTTFAPSLIDQGLVSTRREVANWCRDGITQAELDYRKSSLARRSGENVNKCRTCGNNSGNGSPRPRVKLD